jgi:hypothetical protein
MREKIRLTHIPLAALPLALALAPGLFFALAEGWINAGGGEKDVVLVLPYAIWSLVFLASAIVLIVKRRPLWSWIRRASGIALLALISIAAVAYSLSWLGIR